MLLKALINYYDLTRSIRLTMPHAGGELYPETMAEVEDVAQKRGEKARRSGTKYLKELLTYDEPISTS